MIHRRIRLKPVQEEGVHWVFLLCVITVLAVGTYQRNSLWNDELALWKDCLGKSPHKDRVHHHLGYVYLNLGRFDDAKREFEEALRLNPRYFLSIANLGLVFYRKGLFDEAIRYNRKALELEPGLVEPHYWLGMAYHEKGSYVEAVESYKKFLEFRPDHENVNLGLGLSYAKLGQWERAIQSFQEELRYHPDNYYAYGYLGFAYLEIEDHRKALLYFKKALTYPNTPDAEGIRLVVAAIEAGQRPKVEHGIGKKDERGIPR